jgi:hypothetical protein
MELRVQFNNDHIKGDTSCLRCAEATAIVQGTSKAARYPESCACSVSGGTCGGLRHADAERLLGYAPAVYTACERCGDRQTYR